MMAQQGEATGAQQLLAVSYRFEVRASGERRLVTEDSISASMLGMFLPQLHASAKRSRVDQGPGFVIFDNYKDARQAAQAIATVATTVDIVEVAPTDGKANDGWTAAGGVSYRPVAGGVTQPVKG
jgi:hypothetical protein